MRSTNQSEDTIISGLPIEHAPKALQKNNCISITDSFYLSHKYALTTGTRRVTEVDFPTHFSLLYANIRRTCRNLKAVRYFSSTQTSMVTIKVCCWWISWHSLIADEWCVSSARRAMEVRVIRSSYNRALIQQRNELSAIKHPHALSASLETLL